MPIKFNDVFINLLTIPHAEAGQLVFCFSDRVMQTKVVGELIAELGEAVHPGRMTDIGALEEVRLEPIEHNTLEVGHCEDHLRRVSLEHAGMILEVQLTLDKKCPELMGVGAIKLIWLMDFHPVWGIRGWLLVGSAIGIGKFSYRPGEFRE